MKFWMLLITATVIIVAYPLFRFMIKRITMLVRLSRLCRKNRFSIIGTHPIWFLGGNQSQNCDCYIVTANIVYAVKLFGILRRSTSLIFTDDGMYKLRRYIAVAGAVSGLQRLPIDSKNKKLPDFDFHFKYRDEWSLKEPRNVLLINPVPHEIIYKKTYGEESIIGSGDMILGMEIQSTSRFLGKLESQK